MVGLCSYRAVHSRHGCHGKISITIGRDELTRAKLASKLGLSLSTFITDAVRERMAEQARRDAAREVLATFAPEDRATDDEKSELLELWGAAAHSTKISGASPRQLTPRAVKRARSKTARRK